MKQCIIDFPKQFMEGYNLVSAYQPNHQAKSILIIGIGGSALPGGILEIYLQEEHVPISVCRDYELRFPIGKDTLIFAISYSGNTEETLSCLEKILPQTKNIIVLTAGGQLLEMAKNNNLTYFVVPSGMQPRAATGYFFSAMLGVLEIIGRISPKKEALVDLSNSLAGLINHDEMKTLAKELKGSVPIIYASDDFWHVVRNIKIKFNENAKTQAFFTVFPELNHNEMVGFTNIIMPLHFLIFHKTNDHVRVTKRMTIFKKLMEDKGLPVSDIQLKGTNLLTWIFEASYIGDWLSYYLALEYGIDPEPVYMVEDFKKRMAE